MRKLTQLLLCKVVSFVLSRVTVVTEMSGAPAKPLSYSAAELAFEFDVLGAVDFTVFDASTHDVCGARSADELFRLELLQVLLLVVLSTFESSEVRVFTLEAHVVREPRDGVREELAVIRCLFQSCVFVNSFMLGSLHSHIVDFYLKRQRVFNQLRDLLVKTRNRRFSARTFCKLEVDSWPAPSVLYYSDEAFRMEYVFAVELDSRALSKPASVADDSKVVSRLLKRHARVSRNTIRIESR